MRSPVEAKIQEWYRLPNGEMFKVTDITDEHIQIRYSDGAVEDVEMDIWNKLGHKNVEPDDEWLEAHEEDFHELDFLNMEAAPGTEGYQDIDMYSDYENA